MPRTIKVHSLSANGMEVKEVDIEEAKKLIEKAYTQGNVVIDKRTGNVIDNIPSEADEIILVGILGGG